MKGHFPIYPSKVDYVSTNASLANPIGVDYDPVRNVIGIVNFNTPRNITFIDGTTFNLLSTVTTLTGIPAYIKYDTVGNKWFVGNDSLAVFHTIDSVTYTVTSHTFARSSPVIRSFEIDYANDKIFISSFGNVGGSSGIMYIYKYSDLSLITSFSVTYCVGCNLDVSSNKLYVARHSQANIQTFSSSTYALIDTIYGLGDFVLTTAYSFIQSNTDSNVLYVLDNTSNKVCLLNKSTGVIYAQISGITSPRFGIVYNNFLMIATPSLLLKLNNQS